MADTSSAPNTAVETAAPASTSTKEPKQKSSKTTEREDGKIAVKTTGEFILQDPFTQIVIGKDGVEHPEGVIEKTPFVESRLASGELVLA